SLERHFMGIPGTRMLALHHRCDPAAVYDEIFASLDRPTIVIENKALYALRVTDHAPDGFAVECSDDAFPTTRFRPTGPPDLTILCYGGMLQDGENAVECLFVE